MSTIKKVAIGVALLCVLSLIIFSLLHIHFSTNETEIKVSQQGDDMQSSSLEPEEIENLIENDPKVLSVVEAEKMILEYSKSITTNEQAESLLRHVVSVECDVDGEINSGSGVIMRGSEYEDSTEWYVYTNAHVSGADATKVRMCMVKVPHTAGADTSDTQGVDVYEAYAVYVAPDYPELDFSVLKLVDPKGISDISLRRCIYEEMAFGQKVMILGYPMNTLTITSGYVTNFPATTTYNDGLIETSASTYPGHSGGMGFNLSRDCSIGIVTWGFEDNLTGLIQSWNVLYSEKNIKIK